MHNYFGKESFDKGLAKILNKKINTYLYNVTGIEYDYDFMVKSKKGGNDDYYDWIIEIDTDEPIHYTYPYNDEYKEKKNVHGFHHSVLENKIRDLINSMGVVGSGFLGNTLGIKFMNLANRGRLSEQKNMLIFVIRRLDADIDVIWDIVNYGVGAYICDFDDFTEFYGFVCLDTAKTYLNHYFDNEEQDGYSNMEEFMINFLEENFSTMIKEYWDNNKKNC